MKNIRVGQRIVMKEETKEFVNDLKNKHLFNEISRIDAKVNINPERFPNTAGDP